MPPDYLDPRQIQAFVAVISTGSMTGAARALGRSQSAVSRLIQDLEEDVGFALLHRNGPRIAPTERGVAFFAEAELFLAGLRTIGERARGLAGGAAQPLSLAAIPALAASIAPLALADLAAGDFPQRIRLQSASAEIVVQAVIARTADIGLASLPLDNPGVETHWIGEAPCVAVVAAADPLAAKGRIGPGDLGGRRLIAAANPYRLRQKIDDALAAHDVKTGGRIESNASYVSLALARAGVGVAIVEPATFSGLPIAGVAVLPLTFAIPFRWGVITAAGAPLSTTTQRLIAALERHAAGVPGFRRIGGRPAA